MFKARNRYRNYLSILVLVTVLVIATFKLIKDVRTASVVTSFFFLVSNLGIIFWETKFPGWKKRPTLLGSILFAVTCIIPVIIVRVLSWESNFATYEFLGISGQQLHEFSRTVFMFMLLCIFIDSYTETKKSAAEKRKET